MAETQLQVEHRARDQGEHAAHQAGAGQLPGGEDEADRHRERALEHHRPRDVAERQRVFALAHPDDRVELLGQLGGQRAQDQRDEQGVESQRGADVLHLGDEEARPEDDAQGRHDHLQDDAPAVRHDRVAVEVERLGLALELTAAGHRAPHVPAVGDQQAGRQDPLEVVHRDDAGEHRQGVGDHEERQVAAQHRLVDREVERAPALQVEDDDRPAGHDHGQAREHEGRAQDGPDADVVRGGRVREEDGDDRDEGLGQRRPDGREHAADRALAELEGAPEPLDAVGEQLGGEEDQGEGGEQVHDGHGPGSLPRASYRLTAAGPPKRGAQKDGGGRRRPDGKDPSEPAAKGQEQRRAGRGGRTAAPPYAVKLSRC